MIQGTEQEFAAARNRYEAAHTALAKVIAERDTGGVIDLLDLLDDQSEIDPTSLFRAAEGLWCAGQLVQGQSKREYIIQ